MVYTILHQIKEVPDFLPTEFDTSSVFLPPGVEISVILGRHSAFSDLGPPGFIESKVKEADIHIIEHPGWTPSSLDALNLLSRGDDKLDIKRQQNPYLVRLFDAIKDSGIVITTVDVPEHTIAQVNYQGLLKPSDEPDSFDSFEQAIERRRGMYKKIHPRMKKRDQWMLDSFGNTVQGVIDSSPELQARQMEGGEPTKIIMTLGHFHEGVIRVLRTIAKDMTQTQIEVQTQTLISPHTANEQLYSRYLRGLDFEDLLARDLLEMIFAYQLIKTNQDINKTSQAIDQLTEDQDHLQVDDLRELYRETVGHY